MELNMKKKLKCFFETLINCLLFKKYRVGTDECRLFGILKSVEYFLVWKFVNYKRKFMKLWRFFHSRAKGVCGSLGRQYQVEIYSDPMEIRQLRISLWKFPIPQSIFGLQIDKSISDPKKFKFSIELNSKQL